jgi:hypothetical protein
LDTQDSMDARRGGGANEERLVRRLELDVHAAPSAFRRRVMLLGMAAHGAIAAMLGLMLLLAGLALRLAVAAHVPAAAAGFALLALLPAAAVLLALRALCIRIPAPSGRPLSREEAPALFDMLDRVRAKLDGPRIDHVLVDDRYNAAIAQRARFGSLFGHVNYLVLGLPYLLGVPARELVATVVHEYGHLCGNHGKAGARIVRQRLVFGMLHDHVRARAAGSAFHRAAAAVLDRLMPLYHAYAFVLSRQNEYEADGVASALAGAVANAQGLVRDTLQGRWIADTFWPTLLRQAEHAPQPSFMPFASMKSAFRVGYAQWAQPEMLAAALAVRSGVRDSHPCLRDRVDAIGERPALPRPVDRTAADTLLPPATLHALVGEFDAAWWRRAEQGWQARHREVNRERTRLAELGALTMDELSLADLHELALLRAERESPAAAKEALAHLLARPGGPFPRAEFHYGRFLLASGDDAGLFHLEAAVAHDCTLVEAATDEGCRFLEGTKGARAARLWRNGLLPRAA